MPKEVARWTRSDRQQVERRSPQGEKDKGAPAAKTPPQVDWHRKLKMVAGSWVGVWLVVVVFGVVFAKHQVPLLADVVAASFIATVLVGAYIHDQSKKPK